MTITFVARALRSGQGPSFNLTVPASRQVGDLMLVGIGTHASAANLPSGFTLLNSPEASFKVGYQISTASGGGTITATSSGGSFGTAWLVLYRGFDPATHEVIADGTHKPTTGVGNNTIIFPALPVSGSSDSLQLATVFIRSNASRTLNTSGFTTRWNQTTNDWPSTLDERMTTTPESVGYTLGTGAGEAAGWNIYIYKSKRPAMSVGFLRLG